MDNGKEYAPFVNVAWNGEAWVNDGNHRIMAAAALGWKDLPVQISYFDGGERIKSGAMYPERIGLGGIEENFADSVGQTLNEVDASAVQFRTASTDNYQNSFTVTAIADGKTVGHFSFFRDPETDDVHNQAEVTDDVRGKGYGKTLLLKAIEVANDHGLGFQEDSQSVSRAQSRVYDSLYDAGWIVDADGYWFLTPEGEQELARLGTINEKINRDIRNRRFEHSQRIGDYTYKATVEIFMGNPLLWIKAYHGNKEIGHILFELYSDHLQSGGTEVDPNYRNKGVASTMYAYAKMLGNDIKPSYIRTDQGKGMWAAWEKSGDAKHLGPEVKENFADGKNPGRKGLSKRVGVNTKASVSSLRKTAKNSSGEKQRMAHWLANMKAGRAKAKRK
jgi:GNAT superfamily N-acetyltransferase